MKQLEQHAADGVEVRARVDLAARRLLGRHVLGRAEDGAGAPARVGLRLAVGLREAEIEHLHAERVGEEQVRRLDVAVDEVRPVRDLERGERLVDDAERLAVVGALLAREEALERLALEQLHHAEEAPVGRDADVEDRDEVLVLEP